MRVKEKRPKSGRKTFVVDVKAVAEGGAGFTGYASVFGNVDSYGDVMLKGAFAQTLADDYGENGAGVPVYWQHRMDDPMMNIGITRSAVEDDTGLLVDVALGDETAVEKQVRRLLLEGRVKQMSFAFDYLEASWVEKAGEEPFYEVRAVKLHEVSVVPVGANQETSILSAKAADLAARGRKALEAVEEEAETATTVTVDVAALADVLAVVQSTQESLTAIAEAVSAAIPTDDADEAPTDPVDGESAADPNAPDGAADADEESEPKSAPSLARIAALRLRASNALSGAERGSR